MVEKLFFVKVFPKVCRYKKIECHSNKKRKKIKKCILNLNIRIIETHSCVHKVYF